MGICRFARAFSITHLLFCKFFNSVNFDSDNYMHVSQPMNIDTLIMCRFLL